MSRILMVNHDQNITNLCFSLSHGPLFESSILSQFLCFLGGSGDGR